MPEFKLHEAFAQAEAEAAAGSEGDGGAEEYKKRGNAAFSAKDWDEAIKNYNKAIQLDPNQASFYSNRAACWSCKGNHESALADAKKCLAADPSFVKGYSRQGKALFDLGRLSEARSAYREGLSKDQGNAGCLAGLAEIDKAEAQASRGGAAGAAAGAASDGFAKVSGWARNLMDRMKGGGMGGRMQMYAVVMLGYMAYNSFIKPKAATGGAGPTTTDLAEDEDFGAADAVLPRPRRGFAVADGSWVSYLEVGSGDSLVLMLHSTPLSAEVELAPAMGQVLERAASTSPGGIRVFAPDRPCHGFSPCPKVAGKAHGTGWLEALLRDRPSKRLALVASGRGAARQALALARERRQPSLLLLVSPTAPSPSRGGAPLAGAAEARTWLEQSARANSAAAFADAARWAASSAEEGGEEERLQAAGLPEGSRVALLYASGEKEEADFREELEGTGLLAKSRRLDFAGPLAGSPDFAEAVGEEVARLLSASDDLEA